MFCIIQLCSSLLFKLCSVFFFFMTTQTVLYRFAQAVSVCVLHDDSNCCVLCCAGCLHLCCKAFPVAQCRQYRRQRCDALSGPAGHVADVARWCWKSLRWVGQPELTLGLIQRGILGCALQFAPLSSSVQLFLLFHRSSVYCIFRCIRGCVCTEKNPKACNHILDCFTADLHVQPCEKPSLTELHRVSRRYAAVLWVSRLTTHTCWVHWEVLTWIQAPTQGQFAWWQQQKGNGKVNMIYVDDAWCIVVTKCSFFFKMCLIICISCFFSAILHVFLAMPM